MDVMAMLYETAVLKQSTQLLMKAMFPLNNKIFCFKIKQARSMFRFTCSLIVVIVSTLLAACSESKQTIKIKGSDTEVNVAVILAERFHNVDPSFLVSVSGGGSGLGIASLLNQQTDIANSSREINSVEDSLFKKRNVRLKKIVFAEDAIAFIVHKDCALDSISLETLAKVFNGNYKNWRAITNVNLPINIYGRQSNSGTYAFIKKKLKIEFSEYAKEMNGNAQIIEGVIRDRSGIGYVGAGYVAPVNAGITKQIKVLKIYSSKGNKAVSPLDTAAIKARQYPFQRPLYQFVRLESLTKAQAFLDFEKSHEGTEIIKASGYYPVTNEDVIL